MKRSFITKMPDKAGAFLQASRIISRHGGNIVRVNYNRSVDIYTLFIDVSADEAALELINRELEEVGYLAHGESEKKVILFSLRLRDVPGAVTSVLEVLGRHEVNIYYMSSQENGSGYQNFKMGLHIEQPSIMKRLLDELSTLCEVEILEYDATEKMLDNTVFYIDFGSKVRELLSLSEERSNKFLVYANRIMQILDERNEQPFKTFDLIYSFAEFVQRYKGTHFNPIITDRRISDEVSICLIEPPCGSNTYILKSGGELLFIDCGFACYRDEMLWIFREMFPDFDNMPKSLALTHSDIDHVGLASLFDRVYVSGECRENFLLEQRGEANLRERSPLSAAYCKLSKIISGYSTPDVSDMQVIGEKRDGELLSRIGSLRFLSVDFDVYEGDGGHVPGETLFVSEKYKLVFTGDVFVNIKGFSKEQKAFNAIAPYLMTSVDMEPKKAAKIRKEVVDRFKCYLLCPGHGKWMENV